MEKEVVFVINSGSTSTKIAIYNRKGEIVSESISHPQNELVKFDRIADQLDYRYGHIKPFINKNLSNSNYKVIGVVGRGGIVKPIKGGTYRINQEFLDDARSGQYGEHASNLGSLLANRLKNDFGLSDSYTVDPVSTTNISAIAEITGVPDFLRDGRAHTLNIKITARKIASQQGIPFEESCYIIAHLGGGISISLIVGGKIIDVNDGLLGMGPFTPNRSGALPLRAVMKLCYSKPENEVIKLLTQNSGFKAYLGTEDVREVVKMVENGDKKAELIYNAFIYQISKNIGAYFAASKCKAQGIVVTGGIAHNNKVTNDLKKYVGTLTNYYVYPGENEMEALAEGIFRVIDKQEEAIEY